MTRVEQYIKDYTRGCSNELSAVHFNDGRMIIEYHEWLTPENAMAAAEIAREEVIEKACTWLDDFLECSPLFEYHVSEDKRKDLLKELRMYMEG